MTETMTETALIVAEELNAIELFTGDAMTPLLARIKALAEQHVPDTSTAAGRKEIASIARKVASSKVILDNLGKDLVSDWKRQAKKVDEVRKQARDNLDALKEQVRAPLTAWEAEQAEQERLERLAAEIAIAEEDAYAEESLRERERVVREKEAEQQRQDEERRQKEHDAQVAKEAEEKAKREVNEALQRERERADQAERDRIAAEAKAEADKKAAVEAAERRAREDAERKERERIATEKAEREAQERKAANKRHRLAVQREAIRSLINAGIDEPDAERVIALIDDGAVSNVTINY